MSLFLLNFLCQLLSNLIRLFTLVYGTAKFKTKVGGWVSWWLHVLYTVVKKWGGAVLVFVWGPFYTARYMGISLYFLSCMSSSKHVQK